MDNFVKRCGVMALSLAGTFAAGLSTSTAAAAPVNGSNPVVTAALQEQVKNIVVIYAENRAFDNLYGNFPGAHGLSEVVNANGAPNSNYVTQKDRNGSELPSLPMTWGGVTAPGQPAPISQAQSGGLANAPFSVETAFTPASGVTLSLNTVTRDLYHRFFNEQMELGPNNLGDYYAAWADAGGLTMGHFDNSGSKLYKLAQQYVLADNFFAGAFGGSFLNHQYLICACAPEYADAATRGTSRISVLNTDPNGNYLPFLKLAANNPASALSGPPTFVNDGAITPANYFGDNKYYGINTLQPPFQPSTSVGSPASGDPNHVLTDLSNNSVIPVQTATNIGDELTSAGINWKWYSGAWNFAVQHATGTSPDRAFGPFNPATGTPVPTPNFQSHHQPFNYYAAQSPIDHPTERAAHLQDYTDLIADAAAGTLPPVAFYKPEGDLNQHEGYTNVTNGDDHIASVIAALQASPQYPNMVIVLTYDEFGGVWDHVHPPKADKLGPGTRLPALVISPLAKTAFVDHTQYDTASILRLITRRFSLPVLAGLSTRDAALVANGLPAMGDLTNALTLPTQSFAFSASTYSVHEQSSQGVSAPVNISVVRTGDLSQPASVQYATAAGSAVAGVNYTDASGTLNFAAGVAKQTFAVTPIRDNTFTAPLTVDLALSAPSTGAILGATPTATLNITNVDAKPSVDLATATDAVTAPGTVTVTANLSNPGGADVTVLLAYRGNLQGVSFPTGKSILIPAGMTTGSVTLNFVAPRNPPATGSVQVIMAAPRNAVKGTTTTETISVTY